MDEVLPRLAGVLIGVLVCYPMLRALARRHTRLVVQTVLGSHAVLPISELPSVLVAGYAVPAFSGADIEYTLAVMC